MDNTGERQRAISKGINTGLSKDEFREEKYQKKINS
jgi:hypothetical protein